MYSPMMGMDLSSLKAGDVTLNLNPDFEYSFLVVQGDDGERLIAPELL